MNNEVANIDILHSSFQMHPLARVRGARWLSQQVEAWHYRLFGQHRYNRLVVERVRDRSLIVLPQVFNPVLLFSGALLADCLALHGPTQGQRILDLGCGSGVGALFAALRGAQVVASDINPHAVRCARINALLHALETQIDVRQGNLFETVSGETFDLILFNPPYYEGKPATWLDYAWRGDGVIEHFAAGLSNHLAPGGRAWLVLSVEDGAGRILHTCAAAGWQFQPLIWRHRIHESLGVWEARK